MKRAENQYPNAKGNKQNRIRTKEQKQADNNNNKQQTYLHNSQPDRTNQTTNPNKHTTPAIHPFKQQSLPTFYQAKTETTTGAADRPTKPTSKPNVPIK